MAKPKQNFQKLAFNPATQKLVTFLDELQKLAKYAIGITAQAIIEQFIYSKMPPHLRKSTSKAHLKNGTHDLIVTHLDKEIELNGSDILDELEINAVT